MKRNQRKRKNITPTDEYIYHITSAQKWNRIERSTGLYGSLVGASEFSEYHYSEKGYLYVVDLPEIGIWNGVAIVMTARSMNEKFVVLGIKKSYLNDNGYEIEEDAFKGQYHQYFRQINLGTTYIPLTDVIDFGKYYINSNLWDYKDKWEYKARILGVAPEQVIIEDEDIGAMYGLINNEYGYADRFNITERGLRKRQDLLMYANGYKEKQKIPSYV